MLVLHVIMPESPLKRSMNGALSALDTQLWCNERERKSYKNIKKRKASEMVGESTIGRERERPRDERDRSRERGRQARKESREEKRRKRIAESEGRHHN